MEFEKSMIDLVVPLIYDTEKFDRAILLSKAENKKNVTRKELEEKSAFDGKKDSELWFQYCFTSSALNRSFQLDGSPLLNDGSDTLLCRFELNQPQREMIGIHKNESHIYILVKEKTEFQIRKIKLWILQRGIAFLTIEVASEKKDSEKILNLSSELSSVQMKYQISFDQHTGKDIVEKKTVTIKKMIESILKLQEFIPLSPYPMETFKKAHYLFCGIGKIEKRESLLFFLEMLRMQRKSNMRAADGVSEEDRYCPFDYITWAMSDNVLAVVGDLERGGTENEYFLTNPGGLQKTVLENYLPVYLYYYSISLKLCTIKEKNTGDEFEKLRKMPLCHLTSEPHINELFEERMCDRIWNIQGKMKELKDEKNADRMDHFGEQIDKMSGQLDRLVRFVETDMQDWLFNEKRKLKQSEDELEEEQMVSGFIGESSGYINRHIQQENRLFEEEIQYLKNQFGYVWEKLLPSSKTSLVSARILWKQCSNIRKNDFDFSGVCISATSALEAELKKIFFSGFQDYMVQKYGEPDSECWQKTYEIWPERLLSKSRRDYEREVKKGKKPSLERETLFTMGMLPYLFGKYDWKAGKGQDTLIRNCMEEYLRSIMSEQYKENPLSILYCQGDKTCLVERCEQVRNDYRNPAAHVNVLSRDCAEECYLKIIGKLDAMNYTTNITGLIIMLYDYLK